MDFQTRELGSPCDCSPLRNEIMEVNALKPIVACMLAVLAGACSQYQTPMTADNATAKIVVLQSGT